MMHSMRGSIMLLSAAMLVVISTIVLLGWQHTNWLVRGWSETLRALSANNQAVETAMANPSRPAGLTLCSEQIGTEVKLCLHPQHHNDLSIPILDQRNLGPIFPAFDLAMPGVLPWSCAESNVVPPLFSRTRRACVFSELTVQGEQAVNGSLAVQTLIFDGDRLLVSGALEVQKLFISADSILLADGDIQITELQGPIDAKSRVTLISLSGNVSVQRLAQLQLKIVARREASVPAQFEPQSDPLLPPRLDREPVLLGRAVE